MHFLYFIILYITPYMINATGPNCWQLFNYNSYVNNICKKTVSCIDNRFSVITELVQQTAFIITKAFLFKFIKKQLIQYSPRSQPLSHKRLAGPLNDWLSDLSH